MVQDHNDHSPKPRTLKPEPPSRGLAETLSSFVSLTMPGGRDSGFQASGEIEYMYYRCRGWELGFSVLG